MIVGLGLDVVELDRIARILERHGERFIQRILTPAELLELPGVLALNRVPFLAARFAAKEAASKALGTGFRQGVGLQTLEVRSLPSGKPVLHLLGPAQDLARTLGVTSTHISLTHGRDVAAAVVVLEA